VSRLSIVIPALGKLDLLESGLVSVLENRPARSEILVVLNDEYDDPYDLKEEVRFVTAPVGTGLIESVNVGIAASVAPIVHLLAGGAQVTDGWTEAPLARFADPQVAAVASLVLDGRDSNLVLEAGVEYHPGGKRLPRMAGQSVEQLTAESTRVLGPAATAAFYRKEAVTALGLPFDPAVGDLLADVDLALRLREAGHLAVFEPASRIHYTPDQTASDRSFALARAMERLFWRHAGSVGWLRSLSAHGLLVAAESSRCLIQPTNVSHLAGRLAGWLEPRRTSSNGELATDEETDSHVSSIPAPHRRPQSVHSNPIER
jgi:GT2 family glycosyltransferase